MAERPAPEGDVVLKSRVRVARNYADIPFAPGLSRESSEETIRRAQASVRGAGEGDAFETYRMRDLADEARRRLVERHLISPDLLKFAELSAALISSGETYSVMVNEEDHLRIQGLLPGLQIERCAELAFQAERWLGASHPFAFDRQFGYLTSCPTNAGTGLRVSSMLHLPALTRMGRLSEIAQAIGKLGMTVRGIYGEGSRARGHLFQLSNQASLGRCEEDIVRTLVGATMEIASSERKARGELYERDALAMEDSMMRALAVAKSARLMGSDEFMDLYSELRIAASAGRVPIAAPDLDRLMEEAQPASLSVRAGERLDERGENAARAEILRESIAKWVRH